MNKDKTVSSDLIGRLRNTTLKKSQGLMPLYEAIVNSIHSLDETPPSEAPPSIQIHIKRHETTGELDLMKSKRGPEKKADIDDITITDNGAGFTDENWESFCTLDSRLKISKGCRGVGRLLWLKAFRNVRIESVFDVDDSKKLRVISFDANKGFTLEVDTDSESKARHTKVELRGFLPEYSSKVVKTTKAIADSILDHCLWYFLRDGGAPDISISDGDEEISLNDLYEEKIGKDTKSENVLIKGESFELIHLKYRTTGDEHKISYCAENRSVSEEKISGKIHGLHGRLEDSSGEFTYACYVRSELLDQSVRPERDDFVITTRQDDLLDDLEISLDDIRARILKSADSHLSEYLEINRQRSQERVDSFVREKAPQYRPIIKALGEDISSSVDPKIKDKDLDVLLHKKKYDLEKKTLEKGHELEETPLTNISKEEYSRKLNEYLLQASDLNQSNLAKYVSHRRLVIDLLSKALEKDEQDNYNKEDFIHNFIMPMASCSDESINSSNLWLIDDGLAFHDYLASDKTLKSMPITQSEDTKEPDLAALKIYDNPIAVSEGGGSPCGSLVVVELKRPMRNDMKAADDTKDPIVQSLDYIDRIREGRVTTSKGRPISNAQNLPGFCYVLADMTQSMKKCCRTHDLTITSDGLGYFGYNKNYQCYVEVISFERMLNLAKQRNRAFFEKLGIPST